MLEDVALGYRSEPRERRLCREAESLPESFRSEDDFLDPEPE